jgi:hypothetical protein
MAIMYALPILAPLLYATVFVLVGAAILVLLTPVFQ